MTDTKSTTDGVTDEVIILFGGVSTPIVRAKRDARSLPTLAEWEKDPDAASPICPACGWYLGVTRGQFRLDCRDQWTCERCGADYDAE